MLILSSTAGVYIPIRNCDSLNFIGVLVIYIIKLFAHISIYNILAVGPGVARGKKIKFGEKKFRTFLT